MNDINQISLEIKKSLDECGFRLVSDIIISNYDGTAKVIVDKDSLR